MNFLDGEQLKISLENDLAKSQSSVSVISAYVTQTGIDWLLKHVPPNISVCLVCRLQPNDVVNGATHLSALRTALDNGYKVLCLHSLHAKIYTIDREKIYAGSANLTSNGLRIYGKGNLGACSELPANENNIAFIDKITSASQEVSLDMLRHMQECIDKNEVSAYIDTWPNDIHPPSNDLWVRDLFWCNLSAEENSGNDKIHDLDILRLEAFSPTTDTFKDRVKQSRAINWLVKKLEIKGELYFGELTAELHTVLQDDPAPYRQDVKKLVQNLLSYCKVCLPDQFEISRPNHSERIKLLVTG